MSRRYTVALALLLALTSATVADGKNNKLKQEYSDHWYACQDKDKCDPGRNIRKWGDKTKKGVREASPKALRKGLRQLKVNLAVARAPKVVPATTSSTATASSAEAAAGSTSGVPANPNCESGGDPTAVDPSGKYRGKWQFDQQTWDAYAPPGYAGSDPAAVPEGVQDQAAANVPYDAWPNC